MPAALTLKIRQATELFSTGIEEVDAVLGGGIPRGSITEIAGAASAGKTSFALSSIAAITQSGAACAWVDVSDALSPESAAAAHIVMKRLLWLRMSPDRKKPVGDKPWSRLEQALTATDLLLQAGGFAAIVLDMSDVCPQDATRIPLQHWYRFRLAAEQPALHLFCSRRLHAPIVALRLLCVRNPPAFNPSAGMERWPYSRRAERAGQSVGPLFQDIPDEFEIDSSSPLLTMTVDERAGRRLLYHRFYYRATSNVLSQSKNG